MKKATYSPDQDCIRRQKDINTKMIDILFEWMAEVCLRYKFQTETFYLAVNLVYRYLSLNQVTRDKLQLLGATTLFMAGKYEEIYPPQLKEYLSLCENFYSKTEMLAVETKILAAVDFKLAVPTALKFLHRYSQLGGFTKTEHYFACFLLELAIVSSRIALSCRGSMLAAACVYLTIKVFSRSPEWPTKLEEGTALKIAEIQPIAKEVFILVFQFFGKASSSKDDVAVTTPEETGFQAIRRKYSTSEYCDVGRLRFEWKAGLRPI